MKTRILLFLLLTGALSAQIRVNVGGPQYTDSSGLIWSADTGCTSTSTYSRTNPISGTNDPTLFRTARIGNQVSCSYSVTTPAIYTVTLLFAETDPMVTANSGVAGARPRVMTIYINGQEYYSPLNVMASSAFAAAYTLTTPYLSVLSETSITININQIAYQAMLSGIDIEPIQTSNVSSGFVLDSIFSTFSAACAATPSNNTLLLTKVWTNVPSQSCPVAILGNGGTIQPGAGQTVTLGPKVNCGWSQVCYDITAGGTIQFTQPPTLTPVNFGADLTGSAAVSAAFLAAWKAAAVTSGGSVRVPCGTYKFLTPVVFTTAQQQSMLGSGTCTTYNWAGSGGGSSTMLLFPNCFACEIGNAYMDINAALGAAIQTENAGSGFTATQDIFRSIIIQGRANVGTCFLLDGPVDGNNDQQRFVDDHCYGYTSAAWQLGNASSGFNVLDIDMDHSTFVGSGFGLYGVWLRHGSFHWHDGDGGGNYGADFELDTAGNDGVKIDNGEFEVSKQFIRTLVGAGVALAVDVHDVTWDGTCLGQTQAQIKLNCPGGPIAGDMMYLGYPGPWVFTNNHIGVNTQDVLATVGLELSPQSWPSSFTFIGNTFATTAATNAALFSTALPTLAVGTAIVGPGSTLARLPDLHNLPITFNQLATFSVFPNLGTTSATSFTPTIAFGGASTGVTYTTQTGSYFKIADVTFFSFGITLSAKGSSTGVATIGNLPSTAAFGGQVTLIPASDFTGLTVPVNPIILNGANFISLYDQNTIGGTGAGALTEAQFTNTSAMFGTGWYK